MKIERVFEVFLNSDQGAPVVLTFKKEVALKWKKKIVKKFKFHK